MTLQYDPEFASLAGPALQQLAQTPRPAVHDIATRRAMMEAMTNENFELPNNVEKITHHVPAPDGHQVTVYHFRLRREIREAREPAIVHIHGGGFIALSAAQTSEPLAIATARTGVQIFTVDYRLAPEHPYPVPLDDCWAALQWVYEHTGQLSVDPSRIAVMGESAGGGLAVALALKARDHTLTPPLAKQILMYPMLDDRTATNHAGDLAFWTLDDNITGWTAYLGSDVGTNKVVPYAAPARVQSVEGLPPLYFDCPQLDIFVHEGVEYVHRFVTANIPTECHIYPGLPHGFEALAPSASITSLVVGNRHKAMSSF
ncbi:hypothetical protein N7510_006536 [Penicillium lagena]|uniref:uncharacterized protein n=1 Tax=Penicillium lagena TaxID=94218 RepID=UPI002541DDE4|nr:uncharacterized protein N7510_006536 [Penicillium lagena]KAJ5613342.1 hypothetical protein N7510_006536 [Penicillium lagena]